MKLECRACKQGNPQSFGELFSYTRSFFTPLFEWVFSSAIVLKWLLFRINKKTADLLLLLFKLFNFCCSSFRGHYNYAILNYLVFPLLKLNNVIVLFKL